MRPFLQSARSARIQGKIDLGYGKAAKVLGLSFYHYRPERAIDPISPAFLLRSVLADFTVGSASGFNYDKSPSYDDIVWHGLVDGSGLDIGDYLVGVPLPDEVQATYFVAAMPPLKPIVCILCNRTISHLRGNSQVDADGGRGEGAASQFGSEGTYWGSSSQPDTDDQGAGERTLASNVPVALMAQAGAARGQGEVPSEAPGPIRWRAYLPPSVFPKGSVETRDILVDDEGARYQVGSDGWTSLGYRLDLVRLEN